jgi:hypothetical protein
MEPYTPIRAVHDLGPGREGTSARDLGDAIHAAAGKMMRKPTTFVLWLSVYCQFLTFYVTVNDVWIVLDRFLYARNHLGAHVSGDLLTAILMRNELFDFSI